MNICNSFFLPGDLTGQIKRVTKKGLHMIKEIKEIIEDVLIEEKINVSSTDFRFDFLGNESAMLTYKPNGNVWCAGRNVIESLREGIQDGIINMNARGLLD